MLESSDLTKPLHLPMILHDLTNIPSFLPNRFRPDALIGQDTESGELIRIGEEQRCGGMYILGRPTTGNSNLLMSLALADIERDHGLLFIDPHTDAINDLAARIPDWPLKDVMLLDQTDKTRSFAINLLHCRDPSNGQELDTTYGRVFDVFAKV